MAFQCGKKKCDKLVFHVNLEIPAAEIDKRMKDLVRSYKRTRPNVPTQPLRLINYCVGCPEKDRA